MDRLLRRYVPESDPARQEVEEHKRQEATDVIFGTSEIQRYDHFTKASQEAEVSAEQMRIKLERMADKEHPHAKQFARLLEEYLRYAHQMREESKKVFRNSFFIVLRDLESVLLYGTDEERKRYLLGDLRVMLDHPETKSEFEARFGADLSKFTLGNFTFEVIKGSFSDRFFYVMAERHVEAMREKRERLDTNVAEIKKDFKQTITQAVERRFLPASVLEALARIDTAVVSLSDSLIGLHSGVAGESHGAGVITIKDELLENPPKLKHTLFHEFLHELSGKSITIPEEKDAELYVKKSGITINALSPGHVPNTWINEAITEWLALRLSGYKADDVENAHDGSPAYIQERKELERLLSLGLEEEILIRAYFENFSSEQPVGEKGKYFARLVKRINELEGPAGFMRLENRQILRDVKRTFQYYGSESTGTEMDLSPGAKSLKVRLSVGRSDRTVVAEDVTLVLKPLMAGSMEIVSVAEYQKMAESALNDAVKKYRGKVKFSVE